MKTRWYLYTTRNNLSTIPLEDEYDCSKDDNHDEFLVSKNEEGCNGIAVLQESNGRTRRKRRHVDSLTWFHRTQYSNRQHGKKYFERVNKDYRVQKLQRTLKTRCSCSEQKKKSKLALITEEDRGKIFRKFWALLYISFKDKKFTKTI